MIIRAQEALEKKRVSGTAKSRHDAGRWVRCKICRLAIQRLPQLARARQGGIDVQVSKLVNRLGANVSRGDEEFSWKLTLYHQVPGFDVPPLQFTGANGALKCLRRQRNYPAADIRTAYRWNADRYSARGQRRSQGRKRSGCRKSVDSREVRADGQRVKATQRSGQRERIDCYPETRSHHRVIVDLVGQSDARRE